MDFYKQKSDRVSPFLPQQILDFTSEDLNISQQSEEGFHQEDRLI